MEFEDWLAEVRLAEEKMWAINFGPQEQDQLPSWSLLVPEVWESIISGTASYEEGYESYKASHKRGTPPQDVASVTLAVHMGSDWDFQHAMASSTPPEYILAINEAYASWLMGKGAPGYPHNIDVSERLFAAGVPAQYAAALIRAGVSEYGVTKYHSEGIPAEYALEVFATAVLE